MDLQALLAKQAESASSNQPSQNNGQESEQKPDMMSLFKKSLISQINNQQTFPLLDHLVDPIHPFPEPLDSNLEEINQLLNEQLNREIINEMKDILYDRTKDIKSTVSKKPAKMPFKRLGEVDPLDNRSEMEQQLGNALVDQFKAKLQSQTAERCDSKSYSETSNSDSDSEEDDSAPVVVSCNDSGDESPPKDTQKIKPPPNHPKAPKLSLPFGKSDDGFKSLKDIAQSDSFQQLVRRKSMSLKELKKQQEAQSKRDPKDYLYKIYKKWKQRNVSFHTGEIKLSKITSEEKERFKEFFFTPDGQERSFIARVEHLSAKQQSQNKRILYQYRENLKTGQRILRVCIKQQMTHSDGRGNHFPVEMHFLQILRFDESKGKFKRVFQTLYDVFKGHTTEVDEACVFSNDYFLPHGERTFFFRRKILSDGTKGFQLMRHQIKGLYENNSTMKLPQYNEREAHEVDGYFLNTDQNFPGVDRSLLKIQFIQAASKHYDLFTMQNMDAVAFLQRELFMITHREIVDGKANETTGASIFYMKNMNKPLFSYPEPTFDKVQCAFRIRENMQKDSNVKYVIMGSQIDYVMDSPPPDEVLASGITPVLTQQERVGIRYQRCQQHFIQPIHSEFNLPFSQHSVSQIFFFQQPSGHPINIFPHHSGQKKLMAQDIQNKQDEVKAEIIKKFGLETSDQVMFADNDQVFVFNEKVKQIFLSEVYEDAKSVFDTNSVFQCTKDFIFKGNRLSNTYHFWTLQPDYRRVDYTKQLREFEKNHEVINQKLFEQFSPQNQTVSQDNFEQSQFIEINNQYIQRLYINRIKKNVVSTHNTITIGHQSYKVGEKFLLLDLHGKGLMSQIKLYEENYDTKLMKYHVSLTAQKAIFFFVKRNYEKLQEKLSGVIFFVVMDLDKLEELSKNHDKALLEENQTEITVMLSTEEFKQMHFRHKELLEYQDNTCQSQYTTNHVDFEIIQDLQNKEVDNFVPFYFLSKISDKDYNPLTPNIKFKTFLCFLNLSTFIYEPFPIAQEESLTSKYLFAYKMRAFKCPHVRNKFTLPYYEQNQRGQDRLNLMMTRSSNWQKNIRSKGLSTKTLSAKFQVSQTFSNYQCIEFDEVQEILVTFNINDGEDRQPVEIEHLALRQVFGSRLLNMFLNQKLRAQNKLIPIMDSKQSIIGAHYMVAFRKEILPGKVHIKTLDEGLVEGLGKAKKAEQQELHKIVKTRAGEIVSVEKIYESGHFDVITFDLKKFTMVPIEAFRETSCQFLQEKCNYKGSSSKQFFMSNPTKPIYFYQAVNLENRANDGQVKLSSDLVQLGFKRYTYSSRLTDFSVVSTTRLRKKIVMDRIFSSDEQLYELYKSQQQNICMSQINFTELFLFDPKVQMSCYFQPRYLLKGRSFCSLDFHLFKNSVQKLKQALDLKKVENKSKYVPNSCLTIMLQSLNAEENIRISKELMSFFSLMGINRHQNFQFDLNNVSFIQKGIDNSLVKPVFVIIDYLLNDLDSEYYAEVLIQDLPQLLCQDKVNVHDFLTRSANEEMREEEALANPNADIPPPCNFETKISNQSLPFLGNDETLFKPFSSFNNIFDFKQEIETLLVQEAFEDDENDKKDEEAVLDTKTTELTNEQEFEQDDEEEDDVKQVEIEHSFLNFQPMIRKIKIDKYCKKAPLKSTSSDYLQWITQEAKDFNAVDDLLIADLIFQQEENQDFFECTAIQKIIDKQFSESKKLLKNLALCYIFGFCIPFVMALFIMDSNFWLKVGLSCISQTVQIFFFVLEYAEVKHSGFADYFSDFWNYIDCSQIFFFNGHAFMFLYFNDKLLEDDIHRVIFNIITIICLLQCFLKLLQYVRINREFGFLVEMIITVFVDLFPFLTIFMVLVLIFTLIVVIMEATVDAGDYPFILKFVMIFIQIFRNSIGDISPIQYGKWEPEEGKKPTINQSISIGIIWFFWLANAFISLIVMLNFLIAEVSSTYDRVKSLGTVFYFAKKAEMNLLAFKIKKYIFKQQSFYKVIVFTSPKNDDNNEDDQFAMLNAQIKSSMQELLAEHRDEMKTQQRQLIEQLESQNKKNERDSTKNHSEILAQMTARKLEMEAQRNLEKMRHKKTEDDLKNIINNGLAKISEEAKGQGNNEIQDEIKNLQSVLLEQKSSAQEQIKVQSEQLKQVESALVKLSNDQINVTTKLGEQDQINQKLIQDKADILERLKSDKAEICEFFQKTILESSKALIARSNISDQLTSSQEPLLNLLKEQRDLFTSKLEEQQKAIEDLKGQLEDLKASQNQHGMIGVEDVDSDSGQPKTLQRMDQQYASTTQFRRVTDDKELEEMKRAYSSSDSN